MLSKYKGIFASSSENRHKYKYLYFRRSVFPFREEYVYLNFLCQAKRRENSKNISYNNTWRAERRNSVRPAVEPPCVQVVASTYVINIFLVQFLKDIE